ncbi:MAG: peptidoglycan DD-metalloendopeptidase family protein [Bacilli bacterium]|nr:peptidoglycan DD-metalloendopeptidase family protein [Bacilli bacterium]MBP3635580.1 peptidoglycan DD-metalloendopeptidase family protein [Bacilli bacterium]
MDNFKKYIPIIISLIMSFIIIAIIGFTSTQDSKIKEVYNVYLDGKLLGSINSKKSLEKYIDKEQKELKEEFKVDKVYIPNGIDIEKCLTHDTKILSEKQIYEKIKEEKSFTIKGYVISIKDSDNNEIKVNVLDKNIFDQAVNKVLTVFVDSKDVDNYKNETQKEIETTGSIIENIYINEKITITESYISTDEIIFTDVTTLTKYLLFGSLDKDEEYVVKPGDTIETVAFNNKLGIEEFLIVNPEFTSSNNLLSVGQKVSIALIDPVFSIVVEKHIVEDLDKPFETVEKEDSSMYVGTTKVETEGTNGVQRVTEKVKYINGDPQPAIITNVSTITEPINKVVLKGTKTYSSGYNGGGTPAVVSGNYGWPTIYPYIVTSEFKYRWGRLHAGLDISGCGFGSPIYSIASGTVTDVVNNCPGQGYYGSSCGGGYGNVVYINHGNGMIVKYAHLNSVTVRVGQTISKGQVVGTMGNSGSSTGTHLHFEVRINGTAINPRTLYR